MFEAVGVQTSVASPNAEDEKNSRTVRQAAGKADNKAIEAWSKGNMVFRPLRNWDQHKLVEITFFLSVSNPGLFTALLPLEALLKSSSALVAVNTGMFPIGKS